MTEPSYDKFDPECVNICKTLNKLPGIETIDSCSGHGRYPLSIFMKCSNLQSLSLLGRCADPRYGLGSVRILLGNSDTNYDHVVLHMIIVSIGQSAYHAVNDFCDSLKQHLENDAYCTAFLPCYDRNIFKVKQIKPRWKIKICKR